MRRVRIVVLFVLAFTALRGVGQSPERAPSYAEALQGIDTTQAFELDSITYPSHHLELKREFGGLSGVAIRRDASGRLVSLRQYQQGKPLGDWYSFDSTGQVLSVIRFEDTTGVGHFIRFFPSGLKESEGPWDLSATAFSRIFAGGADGLYRTFYESGALREEIEYKGGTWKVQRSWYANGQQAAYWIDSGDVCLRQQWCPNGRLIGDITYVKERERLKKERERENERRTAEYEATMKLMQQRGVKGLERAPAEERPLRRRAPRRGGAEPAGAGPLRVFAEGDSWFDYPVPLFGGGIIKRLEKLLGVPVLNLAKAGDEVRYMMGVEERKLIQQRLRDGAPGGPWDAMLFSGGGNDIVDNPMALWILDHQPRPKAVEHIHKERFATALALVRAGYEDLIALRDALSPNTHLLFHGYDYAIPDGRGVCGLGPWLKPTFDLRGFPAGQVRADVVKAMLQQFAAMLDDLQRRNARVTFINGQGRLNPVADSWHNELHPSKAGYNMFAGLFHTALRGLFPGRVL